jgi:hypothetical protein
LIVSRADTYARHGGDDGEDREPFQQWSHDSRRYGDNRSVFPFAPWRLRPRENPTLSEYPDDDDRLPRPPRRVDPDYFWRRFQ